MLKDKKLEKRKEKEKELVKKMIIIYCKGKKHSQDGLCSDCRSLYEYASQRVDRCPFIVSKTFCSKCETHCYKEEMRKKIKEVMRYSGPRILFRHPILAIKHYL